MHKYIQSNGKLIGMIIILCSQIPLFAQKNPNLPGNGKLPHLIKPTRNMDYIEFRPSTYIPVHFFFDDFSKDIGLTADDRMVLFDIFEDALGYKHYRYQQYYKNIKVEGGEYILHELNGRLISANGKLVRGLSIPIKPAISNSTALNLALKTFGAKKYRWQDKHEEQYLKDLHNDPNATYFPTPELVITRLPGQDSIPGPTDFSPSNFVLAYGMDIYASVPVEGRRVYVDTRSGKIFKETALIYSCGIVSPNACTLYDGNQDIITEFIPGDGFRLMDTCRGINTRSGRDFFDGDNVWDSNCQNTQVHWGAEMTYDYLLNVHQRDSYDGNGALMTNLIDFTDTDNAAWDEGRQATWYWPGSNGNGFFASLDIVGHEWAHGLTSSSAGLEYRDESGALNESFSDIFGSMVERYVRGHYGFNWQQAEDAEPGGIRDMSNPNRFSDPDTYWGDHWYSGRNRSVYVHTNSGVPNYWFYLLCVGGTGYHDWNEYFDVTGIGVDKAEAIAYRSLTCYLTSSSDFFDARLGSIWAARDLYGDCSHEMLQTANAWFAVNVHGPNVKSAELLCGDFTRTYHTRVFSTITTGTDCPAPGYTRIHNGAHVTAIAGERIYLKPGFQADRNSKFHAYVFPCIANQSKTGEEDYYDYEVREEPETNITGHIFKIVPNPNNGVFRLLWDEQRFLPDIALDLRIFNSLGKEVYTDKKLPRTNTYIDLGKIASGMYLVSVKQGEKVETAKLVITP